MKLIESKVEILPQSAGLEGIYRQIETAGRTCYKSEDKITTDSAKEFVDRMIKNGHTAMLEHGTVYLKVPDKLSPDEWWLFELANNKYTQTSWQDDFNYITTNFRVLVENDWTEALKYVCEPTEYHAKRVTVRFTCDRGVSHELVRHRVFSFAQESTRYCNYSKDKFGNELTFIIPSWMNLNEGNYFREAADTGVEISGDGYLHNLNDGFDEESLFLYHLLGCEHRYLSLIEMGWKPQQARQILPNALKTEVVMTGFISDWEHFFELRCAPNAHPDMQKVANELHEKFIESKLL